MSNNANGQLDVIKRKIRRYALLNNHRGGIIFLSKLFKDNTYIKNEELQLDMAFMLYHEAVKHIFEKESSKNTIESYKKDIIEAIHICKKIIYKKGSRRNNKNIINARIFLAQIYAILGKPRSVYLAKKNFTENPSAITANRLADVYFRLKHFRASREWYEKYEKLAHKEKIPPYNIYTDMAIFYKKINKHEMAKIHLNKALNNLPRTLEGKSVLSILKAHFDF